GHHDGDRVTDEADLVGGERVELADLAPGGHRDGDHRAHALDVLARVDADDTRGAPGRGGVDARDARVGERAAQERGVEHVGQPHVVDVAAAPGEDAAVLDAGHLGADEPHCPTPMRSAASCTPSTIDWYPVQRQMLPDSSSRHSSSLRAWPSSSMASAVITKPGVQNPHWKLWLSRNASCSGCISPSRSRPSIVITLLPWACTASIRHERTASPSTSTVHAPHTPCSHPTCVPVSSRSSRSTSANVLLGSTNTSCGRPLTVSCRGRRVM